MIDSEVIREVNHPAWPLVWQITICAVCCRPERIAASREGSSELSPSDTCRAARHVWAVVKL